LENIMTTFLIGAAIGAGFTVAFVLNYCKVHTKMKWKEFEVELGTQRNQLYMVTAENARLRVALAAGEMTADGKKVAAMTMAALDAVIGTGTVA
jgi:RsiW-degrading membrane proteinase PrsW (M82 family)